jgi:integrase
MSVTTSVERRTPIIAAINSAEKTRWRFARSPTSEVSNALTVARLLSEAAGIPLESLHIEDVTPDHVTYAVKSLEANGLRPASIRRKIACVGVLGVSLKSCRPRLRKSLKWWLKPEQRVSLVAWLRAQPKTPHALVVADYIDWACVTGLRIEESLRLCRRDFTVDPVDTLRVTMTVPGTKTESSHRTLPLSRAAAAVFHSRFPSGSHQTAKMFPTSYRQMMHLWWKCREFLGEGSNHLCTLKAIRRSGARHLHTDLGLPLDLTRDYLGHTDVKTTMGYLALVGGYKEEEFRKWLG